MTKRAFFFLILLATGSAALLNDCTKYKLTPNICFQQDILPIFISRCSTSGCHGEKQEQRRRLPVLTTYEGILSQVKPNHPLLSGVYTTVSGRHPSMPPAGYPQLTNAEREAIKYWIHTGAKNSGDCRPVSCDTLNVSFDKTVKPIIDTWCTGCHSASNAGGGYDFTTYEGVKTAIAPSNRLSGSIHHLPGFTAMPQNAGMLDLCDLGAIDNWIRSSYPNN